MMKTFQTLNINYQQLNYILISIQAVLGVFGIIGNILAIFVFSRKTLKHHSYSFYWRIIALCDNVLLTEALKKWSKMAFDTSSLSLWIQNLDCILSEFLVYVAGYVSGYILTIISIDRLLVIVYPYRFRVFQRRWFQLLLVFLIVIYSVLLHIRMPFYYRLEIVNITSNTSEISCYSSPQIQKENGFLIMINTVLTNVIINSLVDFKLIIAITASKRQATISATSANAIDYSRPEIRH